MKEASYFYPTLCTVKWAVIAIFFSLIEQDAPIAVKYRYNSNDNYKLIFVKNSKPLMCSA